jgi:glycosyltransferase involved in cell wall biosynthesis
VNVVVYLGSTARGRALGVAHYATNLVKALAARSDTHVTLLGEADVISAFDDLHAVKLVDEASIAVERSSLIRGNDLLIQIHQFQRRLLDLPTVLVVHDVHAYDVGWKYAGLRRKTVWSLHKNLIRADAVVSHFPHTIARVVEVEPLAAGKTRLTVCPSLIADFELDAGTVDTVRRRFRLDDGRPTILYPAQLQLHKNHWNLLTAVYELQREGNEIRLICPGGIAQPESWGATLEQRISYLGLSDVHFPGYLLGRDVRALYVLATAVVSPSLAEGGAYLAQEALAHDRAAACSAIPAALAHLERMSLDIPTFDPYDADAIAMALRKVVDDPDGIVAGYGPAHEMVAGWTWDRLAAEVLTSIEQVER